MEVAKDAGVECESSRCASGGFGSREGEEESMAAGCR